MQPTEPPCALSDPGREQHGDERLGETVDRDVEQGSWNSIREEKDQAEVGYPHGPCRKRLDQVQSPYRALRTRMSLGR